MQKKINLSISPVFSKLSKTATTALTTTLATLAAGQALASMELYSSDTGSLATYGQVQLEVQNYDGENQMQNNGSRLGFTGTSQISPKLEAFANLEFRFDASYAHEIGVDKDKDEGWEVRNTYLGLRGGFGSIKAGNFDSVLATYVTNQADIMENAGWRSLDEGKNNARATAIAYETNSWQGLSLGLGLKHYASKDSDYGQYYDDKGDKYKNLVADSDSEEVNFQLALAYAPNDNWRFAIGADQNNKNGNPIINADAKGKTKPILAASLAFENDIFNTGVVFENNDKVNIANLTLGLNYSSGEIYSLVSYKKEDTESGVDFSLGANYELGDNFIVYGETAFGNDKISGIQDANGKATQVVTLGAAFYW